MDNVVASRVRVTSTFYGSMIVVGWMTAVLIGFLKMHAVGDTAGLANAGIAIAVSSVAVIILSVIALGIFDVDVNQERWVGRTILTLVLATHFSGIGVLVYILLCQ